MVDEEHMRRALELAQRGRGWTNPNPMVGAVIVSDGRVLAEGWHRAFGGLHAERDALRNAAAAGVDVRGATMYVTLEPCCHFGKQPPCTDAIIEAGIARVVSGSSDPNPQVAGRGIVALREHGVEVVEHVLKEECDELNKAFLHYITTGRPLVTLKYAMTLDGKTACASGASRWVTGEAARRHVHEQRHASASVMVGVGTVVADDPLLTCRIEGGSNPIRVVCDSHLRTPTESALVRTAREIPTLIATCEGGEASRAPYLDAGCEVLSMPERHGHVDLKCLVEELGRRGIDSLIIEGGGELAWSALDAGVVDRVQAYIAPKIFGGVQSKTPVGGAGFLAPDECLHLEDVSFVRLGEDLLMEGRVF